MDFQLSFSGFASDCWTATPSSLFAEFLSKTRGQLQDLTGVIVSATAPAIDDQNKAWVRTDGGSGLPMGIFKFQSGVWAWPNDELTGSHVRLPFVGTEAQVWAHDGGDGTNPTTSPPTALTGAMWEVDALFAGRIPMGPGVIPDTNPPQTLAVATDAGSGVHLQTPDEVAPHAHPLVADPAIVNGNNVKVITSGAGASGLLQVNTSGNVGTELSVGANEYTVPATGQEAMDIVPPVRGAYFIKRTSRTHYVA